jgi:hypothetical protein
VPCCRVRLVYHDTENNELGNRFYLQYSGAAPSGANCVSLATGIAAAQEAHLVQICGNDISLVEIDVLDIATNSGLSGQWSGSQAGASGPGIVPVQAALNIELGIARRYRGGKPRLYLPPPGPSSMLDNQSWNSTLVNLANSSVPAFFQAVEALSIGSMGTLTHVSLSYYKGFTNLTNSSGRERAVPTYRPVALHDTVTGYFAKAVMGSQKRRRTSTTP